MKKFRQCCGWERITRNAYQAHFYNKSWYICYQSDITFFIIESGMMWVKMGRSGECRGIVFMGFFSEAFPYSSTTDGIHPSSVSNGIFCLSLLSLTTQGVPLHTGDHMEILSTLSDAKDILLPFLVIVLIGSFTLFAIQVVRYVRFYRLPREERKKYIWM